MLAAGVAEVLAVDASVSFTVVETTSFAESPFNAVVVEDIVEGSVVSSLAADDVGSIVDTDLIVEGSLSTACSVVTLIEGAVVVVNASTVLIDRGATTSEWRK